MAKKRSSEAREDNRAPHSSTAWGIGQTQNDGEQQEKEQRKRNGEVERL
jgi:hypothetical protein